MEGNYVNAQYLQSIKERVENATLGDWIVKNSKVVQDWYLPNALIVASGENGEEADYEFIREEDAEFIAHARQDVPALIAEVELAQSIFAEMANLYERYIYKKNVPTPLFTHEIDRLLKKYYEGGESDE